MLASERNCWKALKSPRTLKQPGMTTSRTAAESDRDNGLSVFEVRSTLRGIHGSMSFVVRDVFYINIHRSFDHTFAK